MAQWVLRHRFGRPRIARHFLGVRFERFGNKFLGAKSDSQCHAKDDSTKKNPEGKLNNTGRDPQMLQSHGEREHNHEPLHADTEEAGVLKIQIDSSNEHTPGKKTGDNIADQQNQKSSNNIGNISEDALHKQIGPCKIEGGDADKKSAHNDQSSDRSRY